MWMLIQETTYIIPWIMSIMYWDADVTFDIQGKICSLRGTLALICADNPAAHLLGGYKSHLSSSSVKGML